LLERSGFEGVEEAQPAFSLMVLKLGKGKLPRFVDNSATVRRRFRNGLTVVRRDQCPYLDDATTTALRVAKRAGIKGRVVELQSAEQVRQLSPSPYGVFGILLNGELLSYHYLLEKDVTPLLRA
jgi:hypothetical protein